MKNGYRVRKKLEKLLVYIFLICCALAVLIPIYMIISSAFKPTLEIKQIPPKLFFKPTLTHFWTIVNDGFLSYFKNTLIITGTNMVISVLFGFLAAYGQTDISKSHEYFSRIVPYLLPFDILPVSIPV